MAPLILNLGPRCDGHQASGRFNPGENPRYTLHARLLGPHRRSEPLAEEKKLFSPRLDSNPGPSITLPRRYNKYEMPAR